MCSLGMVSIQMRAYCLDLFNQMDKTGPFILRAKRFNIRNCNDLNASSFAPGIYFYRFQFSEGNEISGKIVLLR